MAQSLRCRQSRAGRIVFEFTELDVNGRRYEGITDHSDKIVADGPLQILTTGIQGTIHRRIGNRF